MPYPFLNAPLRHPKPVIMGHWVTAALLVIAIAIVMSRELIDDKAARALLLQIHRGAGLLVGLVAIARLAVRSRWPLVDPAMPLTRLQHLVSRFIQWLMYALMLSLPVLGWLLTNARGQAVAFPILGSFPVLIERDLDLADTLEDVHTWAAWALVGLVAMHASAAVWHHTVRRDGVLSAMWPGLRTRH